MNQLVLIPARGRSKGIPNKNIKLLNDRPLISYTIEVARQLAKENEICVSTDSEEIKSIVEGMGLSVPFIRPKNLATDQSSTFEVIIHALNYYESLGKSIDKLILLQPTSPFRNIDQLNEALGLYNSDLDMIVSVKKTKANPYFNLYEENESGYLEICKIKEGVVSRQTAPATYEYNGSLYIINVKSLKKYKGISAFRKVKKYVMNNLYSLDIDEPLDWDFAEMVMNKGLLR